MPLKESRIGLVGGRRVGVDEMAKDKEAQDELRELLLLMESLEKEEAISEDRRPNAPSPMKRSKAA